MGGVEKDMGVFGGLNPLPASKPAVLHTCFTGPCGRAIWFHRSATASLRAIRLSTDAINPSCFPNMLMKKWVLKIQELFLWMGSIIFFIRFMTGKTPFLLTRPAPISSILSNMGFFRRVFRIRKLLIFLRNRKRRCEKDIFFSTRILETEAAMTSCFGRKMLLSFPGKLAAGSR